jgi:hypothetical protein
MAVGFPTKANWAAGDVLTASQMDDLAGTLNTVSAPLYNAAGKNKVINGDFGVWQRGTTFNSLGTALTYCADRFYTQRDGSGATVNVTQQTFTPATAPVAGYEGTYFWRYAQTVAGSGSTYTIPLGQRIEDVRVYSGQYVTLSFWAKADASRTLTPTLDQNFGTGGSSTVQNTGTSISISTTWTRYTQLFSLPSLTGKTIGTSSYLDFKFYAVGNTAQTIDVWGVQLEAGSTATGFQTATGTVQGELAACQRYYERYTGTPVAIGTFYDTTRFINVYAYKVTKRTTPTLGFGAGNTYTVLNGSNAKTGSSISAPDIGTDFSRIDVVTATTGTAAQSGYTTQSSYIEIIAEL